MGVIRFVRRYISNRRLCWESRISAGWLLYGTWYLARRDKLGIVVRDGAGSDGSGLHYIHVFIVKRLLLPTRTSSIETGRVDEYDQEEGRRTKGESSSSSTRLGESGSVDEAVYRSYCPLGTRGGHPRHKLTLWYCCLLARFPVCSPTISSLYSSTTPPHEHLYLSFSYNSPSTPGFLCVNSTRFYLSHVRISLLSILFRLTQDSDIHVFIGATVWHVFARISLSCLSSSLRLPHLGFRSFFFFFNNPSDNGHNCAPFVLFKTRNPR